MLVVQAAAVEARVPVPLLADVALEAQLLDLADLALKARLPYLPHLVVKAQLLALAHKVVAAQLPVLAHKVVEAEVLAEAELLQLLLSRQSFSAAMARSTP